MDARPLLLALLFLMGSYPVDYKDEDWTRCRVPGWGAIVEEEECDIEKNQERWSTEECYFVETFGVDGFGKTCEEAQASAHRACVGASNARCVDLGPCAPHHEEE